MIVATGVVQAGIGLATQVLQLINTEVSRKYLNELVDLQKQILEEESRGYDADDAKLENLYKQLKIIYGAVTNEMQLYQARSGQGVPSAPAGQSPSPAT